MPAEICRIRFEEIFPVWDKHLWPNRTTPIRAQSSMLLNGEHDMSVYNNPVYFYKATVDKCVAGVNSVFLTTKGEYRSRGLFVFPEFRGRGVGKHLLEEGIRHAQEKGAQCIWSLPRMSALKTYETAGFQFSHPAEDAKVEFGPNVYVIKNILVT